MRSLGVIFLADIVGYSKMMAQDEPGTLEKLRNFTKEVIRPTLGKHSANMMKSLGDGWLIELKKFYMQLLSLVLWVLASTSPQLLSTMAIGKNVN